MINIKHVHCSLIHRLICVFTLARPICAPKTQTCHVTKGSDHVDSTYRTLVNRTAEKKLFNYLKFKNVNKRIYTYAFINLTTSETCRFVYLHFGILTSYITFF